MTRARAVVSTAVAFCCYCCSVLFIRCVLRSGKYYIHFNFRFPSFLLSFSLIFYFLLSSHFSQSHISFIHIPAIVGVSAPFEPSIYTPRHIYTSQLLPSKCKKAIQQFLTVTDFVSRCYCFCCFSHVEIQFGFIQSSLLLNASLTNKTQLNSFNKWSSRISS